MIRKENFKESKKIYRIGIMSDFPIAERIPYSRYKRAIKNKSMKTYGFYLENKKYGYISTMEENGVIFISYLAIDKMHRGKGYGTQLLIDIFKFFEKEKYIILEVDSPINIKNEKKLQVINRRKAFYVRNGFEELKQIDYRIFGVRYDLMLHKLKCKDVVNYEVIEAIRNMYSKVSNNMRFFNMKVNN